MTKKRGMCSVPPDHTQSERSDYNEEYEQQAKKDY